MAIQNPGQKQNLIDWAKELLGVLGNRGDKGAVEGVTQAIEGLQADRIKLAVLGKAKRGKSTLLNAILGRKDDLVAPVDKLPASSAISIFRWGPEEKATVSFRDGRKESIGYDRIREFVTEEFNEENSKGVHMVEIEGPFERLDQNLEIIDTPGAGSIHEHHDEILHAFIPQADAVIFLVTARMPLDQDEIDLLQKVKAADIGKIFFAVNRVDESSEEDTREAINHNLRLLSQAKIPVQRMHRISAKTAHKGDLKGSGIEPLLTEIGDFIGANKGKVLSNRFLYRVNSAIRPIVQGIQLELAASKKTKEEIQTELIQFESRKESIVRERDLAEREFQLEWSKAIQNYQQGLRKAKVDVANFVMGRIQSTPPGGVNALSKSLPSLLAQTIEDQLRPVALRFEDEAKKACDGLQATYPALSLESISSETVGVRIRADQTGFAGTLGGVAAATAGFGIASAGAATAASIAAVNAAATSTVLAPSLVGAALPYLGLGFLSPLVTGVATVAAPAAMTTVPLWVALSGPIGWTLGGIGLIAVPLSWRLSKLKMKDKMADECNDYLEKTFNQLQTERVQSFREMGNAIINEVRIRLDRQEAQIQAVLTKGAMRYPSENELAQLVDLNGKINRLLQLNSETK